MIEENSNLSFSPNIIAFDMEMTGGSYSRDEILQLSLVSISNGVLFNEYFKPIFCKSWENTEKIHHITSEMVQEAKTLSKHRPRIRRYLKKANILVGFGIENDIRFMQKANLYVGKGTIIYDLQKSFMRPYSHGLNMPSLQKCAEYCNCPDFGMAHNSLSDAYTTLFCFIKLHGFHLPKWFRLLIADRKIKK